MAARLAVIAGAVIPVAGCWAWPGPRADAPVTGINRSGFVRSVRLVFAGGDAQEYLLAPGLTVTLPADREIVAAVVFTPDCDVLLAAAFGGDSDPFPDGGQIFAGPKVTEAGFTSELAATSGPPATPTTACADVPTPAFEP